MSRRLDYKLVQKMPSKFLSKLYQQTLKGVKTARHEKIPLDLQPATEGKQAEKVIQLQKRTIFYEKRMTQKKNPRGQTPKASSSPELDLDDEILDF